ncbi:MAG: tRNA (adenosine(37)-N6)-threonylcarbamoyltransferase complex dimerization subunit type 1 TsaB [Planctomycetota bacterium]|nr:tRNA (adenosine(37)-N6)-threonylcarbamoyltransferase complex dimerization subunit type 1 TsaB [Planctomycetota bacterium]
MRILALETSRKPGSIALLEDVTLVCEVELPEESGPGRSLAPLIDAQLRAADWVAADLDLVTCTIGPGSFTGLRIGVTTAKTLAYAAGSQILGVPTLDVVAEQAPDAITTVTTVIDAQRGELFAARYDRGTDQRWQAAGEPQIVDQAVWLSQLSVPSWVSGSGLRRLAGELPAAVQVVAEDQWEPRAATVAKIALRRYQAGQRDDFWQLIPRYYRKSAAEEKWDSQQ